MAVWPNQVYILGHGLSNMLMKLDRSMGRPRDVDDPKFDSDVEIMKRQKLTEPYI